MNPNNSVLPTWLDGDMLKKLVQLSAHSDLPAARLELGASDLKLREEIEISETILGGGVSARIFSDSDCAYVVFRGTMLSFANFFLTNFQAATCPHLVLDDGLSGESSVEHQGGKFQKVLPGEVHQGFARAASRLWYGSDLLVSPFLGELSDDSDFDSVFTRRRRRHACFLLLGGLLGISASLMSNQSLGWTIGVTVLSSLFLSLFFGAWESGFFESLVRRRPNLPPHNRALNSHFKDLTAMKRVVFVGHSLGGALAALCFSLYRKLLLQSGAIQRLHLVTIAAPRIGSKAWVDKFEGDHFHFVHDRDWIPQVPPASQSASQAWQLWKFGPIGIGMLVINPFWKRVYEWFWRPEPYSDLGEPGVTLLALPSPKGWFTLFGNHWMKAYQDSLEPLFESLDRRL
jgi:hypothetical protein